MACKDNNDCCVTVTGSRDTQTRGGAEHVPGILGNPGILGQGGLGSGWKLTPSWDDRGKY